MTSLAESYSHCSRVARARARNFYYSFLLLRGEQRAAMCAVYAFMRECDDLSDGPEGQKGQPQLSAAERRDALLAWREQLHATLDGEPAPHPVWPALRHTVARYGIPRRYLDEMIDGVMGDLDRSRIRDFDELYRYCYQVASVVGLTVIHIFGFHSPEALVLAEKCGVAFQLTNILRDVREDACNGRIYLPQADMRRLGVREESLAAGVHTPELLALLAELGGRARGYYQEAQRLPELVERRSRPSLRALMGIYQRLFERIERAGYRVLDQRIRLSSFEKSWILLHCALGRTCRLAPAPPPQ